MKLKLSENALYLLKQRYLKRDEDRNITETPEELFKRVAHTIAEVEKDYDKNEEEVEKLEEEYYDIMTSLKFLPNSPALMNAGTDITNLSACFVIPIEDSMNSIMDAAKNASLVHKAGGGSGFDFSNIRPKGDVVKTSGGTASGPISFMKIFNSVTEVVKQAGRRRGANMGILHCLAGDTPINTLNGKIPIKDLEGKHPYLYCTDGERILIRKAKKIFVNGKKPVVRITFRDDSFLECTKDHRIMLTDGEYKEAGDLDIYDSVTILNKSIYKRYKMLSLGTSEDTIPEHWAVGEMKYGTYPVQQGRKRTREDQMIHHIDSDPLNNNPENIELTTVEEHSRKHADHLKSLQKEIAKRRRNKTLEDVYGKKKAEEWKENMSKARKGKKPWNKDMSTEEYKEHYTKGFKNQYTNHKVMKVEEMEEKEVFDVVMPEFHNFVANDILVHNCWHPDIQDFIVSKEEEGNFNNFNISVGLDSEFMEAVKKDKDIEQINPRTGKVVNEVRARSIWNLILIMAWKNGEPGVLFFDRINEDNPIPTTEIKATNPCSEEPLLPYESCILGSINLSKFVKDGRVQWKEMKNTIELAVRFLDAIIDVNDLPVDKMNTIMRENRKVGLGVMGWHSFLIKKGIKYNSDEGIQMARDVMKFISRTARDVSRELGEEKGNFPNKENSIWKDEEYMRNAALTTVAPTGSTSIIASTSQGIEPLFALRYKRDVEESLGETLIEYPPIVDEVINKNNVESIDKLPTNVKDILVTARNISPEWHVYMQAAFQKYTDAGVSKTVNMSNEATPRDIEEIFLLAFNNGCKGITVYRDGSRSEQLLTEINAKKCKGKVCDL